jgi:hypothetical protein
MGRNGTVESRREKGGSNATAYYEPLTLKARQSTLPTALVTLDMGSHAYRRLTPENAERLAAELIEAAKIAREHLGAGPLPPEPPTAGVAALSLSEAA